ncbi:glycosyltransferase family 4 protein [Oryzomonas japonica]|uniref:Glycosyltransferase family 4 protein n=1 Tax=Oryzomonas japonica TaxID=2603858 RepID=A0A7J4ZS95_9BACT|nr:glycosyltransferase family 4 protein [Oryzomonas japonica]KAB0666164.1 glycosyltransferase family 4 protein [Oryzomonas japonica]
MRNTPYDRNIEVGFRKLLVRLGLEFSRLVPFTNSTRVFFFFPYYHVGGAEKVHAEIVRCFAEFTPLVFFTHQSKNSKFKHLFGREARLHNVWWLFKYTLPFSVGFIAGLINRQQSPVVFGCNSRFFYKMLPYLKPDARRIDLLHAFGGGGEDFSLSAVPLLDARVVINRKTIDDFRHQYAAHDLDTNFLDRIVLIENRISVPASCPQKVSSQLQVLYVGRGSEEKRVHIAGLVATLAKNRGITAEFRFAGDVAGAIRPEDRNNCMLLGEINDPDELAKVYREADVLLLCSCREGFPVVIMEAMANGVVPVTTSVGGIPEHVEDGVNGILITEEKEDMIALKMADALDHFAHDASALKKMSRAAHEYAKAHFAGEKYCKKYHELFFGIQGKGH